MSNNVRCNCRRCTIRSLMGPAIIITIGVLFLLSEMNGDYDFWRISPVILIVVGLISLASALAPMDGHVSSNAPAISAPGSGPNSTPQNPVAGQGQ